MLVTTAGRTNNEMQMLAKRIAAEFNCKFVVREKVSIDYLKLQYQSDILVIGKNRFEFYPFDIAQPFFFHPNSAVFRIKRLIKKESDPFITATNLKKGNSFLDCTLGLASDSIVASFAVGSNGYVEGVEANNVIAFLVETGLKEWETNHSAIDEAMRRIVVKHSNALDVLIKKEDNSIDCVYFDPMFEETISSAGIHPLKKLAHYEELTEEIIHHAKRVAKERVVLKDHFRSRRFEQFQFEQQKRKTAKFHYGIWLKNEQ
ncbi:class I SAM-dependent methyltransferase [Niallia alba]|uniref:class I SAM-dependent methyltransferase n=1 Tax=Niallia alba TaxID=2729105 RepID=UPI00033297A0|nr:class I SAM-dependent methyltransferase [Niallia alba]EOR23496.1 hypothetical protein A499_12431 [Niallia nealsonii AAU1]MED3795706.1 class I SAM-dependent methyltransferase [Niallia alba]